MKIKTIIKSKIDGPTVVVLGCVHGDEKVGMETIELLRKIKLNRGSLFLLIGNPLAQRRGQRFIGQDLNRSFPGKANGNYEERLAFKLRRFLKNVDFVIDIHSSTSNTKSFAIITKNNKKINELLQMLHPEKVVIMNKIISKKALTYYCKAGISLEYGKDIKHIERRALIDIFSILDNLGMTNSRIKNKNKKMKIYSTIKVFKKNGNLILNKKIRNFKLVKKGDAIAQSGGKILRAKENFYPILFGEKNYKDILGFIAKKMEKYESS